MARPVTTFSPFWFSAQTSTSTKFCPWPPSLAGHLPTIFPRQGHYAHDPQVSTYLRPDVSIARIGDLLVYDLAALLDAARGDQGAAGRTEHA